MIVQTAGELAGAGAHPPFLKCRAAVLGVWRWVHPRLYLIALVIYLSALAVPFIIRNNSEWQQVYIRAAERLRAGERIYLYGDNYPYPPLFALLATPFSLMPRHASLAAWFAVNALAVIALCRWSHRAAGGERLDGGRVPFTEHLAFLLGLLLALRYVTDGLNHQQTDIVIGALLMGGCLAIERGRWWTSATAVGLASAMKGPALVVAGYFLMRKKWLAFAWTLAVALGANLLPDLLHGPKDESTWLAQWRHHSIQPLADENHPPGAWYSDIIYNQSLAGAANRYFLYTVQWTSDGLQRTRLDAPLSPARLRILVGGVCALMIAATALLVLRSRRVPSSPSASGLRPPRVAAEYGLFLCLSVLISPMSSKPHFCVLMLPALCLARAGTRGKDRVSLVLLGVGLATTYIGLREISGKGANELALWFGAITASSLALWIGCARLVCQRSLVAGDDPLVDSESNMAASASKLAF